MDILKQEILKGIDKAETIKPSEINSAKWLGIKSWLFPRMRAYLDGYREEEKTNPAKTQEEIVE